MNPIEKNHNPDQQEYDDAILFSSNENPNREHIDFHLFTNNHDNILLSDLLSFKQSFKIPNNDIKKN